MITVGRLTAKVKSLMKEFGEKCHFFNPIDAVLFTIAPYIKKGNERKHRKIVEYIDRYAAKELPQGYSLDNMIEKDCPLWVFWYQGFEQAPPLIKAIHRQLKRCTGSHKVVSLDKSNLAQYVQFPDFIWEKVKSGVISLTHLSDLVRMSLLSEYGGYWIDSTVLLSRPLPDYQSPYYCVKTGRYNQRHVGGVINGLHSL